MQKGFFWFWPAVPILGLIGLVFLVYWPTTHYGYIIDDMTAYQESKKQLRPKGWQLFWKQLKGAGYWNSKLAHLTTTAIHAIVCVLIYLAFGRNTTSYVTAFLFAIHPSNNQGSIWLSGKPYAITAVLVLLGFVLPYISPIAQALAQQWGAVSGLFSNLMFLWTRDFKIAALIVPILIAWRYKTIFNKAPGSKLAGYITNKPAMSLKPYKIIVALKFYGYYLTSGLLGINTGFYHKYMSNHIVTTHGVKESKQPDRYFFIGLAGAVLTLYGAVRGIATPYNFAWGLLWFSINIAMWTQVITMGQHISMRYIYLANIGICLFWANLICKMIGIK